MTHLKKNGTVKENVESLLNLFPETRDNDKMLQMYYWKLVDCIDFSNFEREFIKKATPPESIRRARQLVQNTERRFRATQHVEEGRGKKAAAMREAALSAETV